MIIKKSFLCVADPTFDVINLLRNTRLVPLAKSEIHELDYMGLWQNVFIFKSVTFFLYPIICGQRLKYLHCFNRNLVD